MTREEAIKFWEFRYKNAKDYTDPHWEAQERREHREYVEALRRAIEALSDHSGEVTEMVKKDLTSDGTLKVNVSDTSNVQNLHNTVIRKCSPICAWQVGTQQYPDCVVAEINALPSAEAEWVPREHFDVLKKNYDMLAGLLEDAKARAIGALIPCEEEPGQWQTENGKPSKAEYSVYCSKCGSWSEYRTKYCGNCGSLMKEENDDK